MAPAVIELDISRPWEPPEPPAPRLSRGGRRLAALLVAVIALGLLVAAAPALRLEPEWQLDHQVLGVQAGGGRLFVRRFSTIGSSALLEAHDERDGRALWSAPTALNELIALATARVVVLTTEYGDHSPQSSTVTVLDAATGLRRWHRDAARVVGRSDGRLVIEDLTDVPGQLPAGAPSGAQSGQEAGLNPVPEQRPVHYLSLLEDTGATVWQVDVPAGSVADLTWNAGDYYRLTGFVELSPDGQLRTRDLTTGAVTGTRQLDWSGTIAAFSGGDSFLTLAGTPGEVVIYRAGERGADILDGVTGARLWHWPGELYGGLYVCATDRFCVSGEDGLRNLDSRTGREVWRAEGFGNVLHLDENMVVVSDFAEEGRFVLLLSARTGALRLRLDGWRVLFNLTNQRIVVWRPIDDRHSMLGTLDPRTGRVTVFGRAGAWYGQPECDIADDRIACVVVGAMSVWRLPPERPA